MATTGVDVTAVPEIPAFSNPDDGMVVLAAFKERLSKYNFVFESLFSQKRHLLKKLPEIQSALESAQFIQSKRGCGELSTMYPLTENCHAEATIEPGEKVFVWLGANVMVEYTVEDAIALLNKGKTDAESSLVAVERDIRSLRDCITTSEVRIATIHNRIVVMRQAAKPEAAVA